MFNNNVNKIRKNIFEIISLDKNSKNRKFVKPNQAIVHSEEYNNFADIYKQYENKGFCPKNLKIKMPQKEFFDFS